MKTIKFTTTRETAVLLKEMASNNGTSFSVGGRTRSDFERGRKPTYMSQPASFIRALETQRARPVEEFMAGEVIVADDHPATPETVLRALENGRAWRTKTIAKLAPTIQIL